VIGCLWVRGRRLEMRPLWRANENPGRYPFAGRNPSYPRLLGSALQGPSHRSRGGRTEVTGPSVVIDRPPGALDRAQTISPLIPAIGNSATACCWLRVFASVT
jgi:hypothetical protein